MMMDRLEVELSPYLDESCSLSLCLANRSTVGSHCWGVLLVWHVPHEGMVLLIVISALEWGKLP